MANRTLMGLMTFLFIGLCLGVGFFIVGGDIETRNELDAQRFCFRFYEQQRGDFINIQEIDGERYFVFDNMGSITFYHEDLVPTDECR